MSSKSKCWRSRFSFVSPRAAYDENVSALQARNLSKRLVQTLGDLRLVLIAVTGKRLCPNHSKTEVPPYTFLQDPTGKIRLDLCL